MKAALISDQGYKTHCWLWDGALNRGGYGRIKYNGREMKAHRWVYQIVMGLQIPDGYQIDHLCRNRACVNPDHLEPVTPKENARRGQTTRLSELDVLVIRKSHDAAQGERRVRNGWADRIARLYSITPHYAGQIARKRRWS